MSLTRFHVQNNALSPPPAEGPPGGPFKRPGAGVWAGILFVRKMSFSSFSCHQKPHSPPPRRCPHCGHLQANRRFYCAGSFFLKYFQLVGSPSILGKTCSNSCTDLGHAVPKRTLGLRWSACGCHPICPTQRLTGPNEGCFLLSFLRPTGCFRVGPGFHPKLLPAYSRMQ